MTEFQDTPLEAFFQKGNWAEKLSLLFLIGAVLVILCGHMGLANALNRQVTATVKLHDGFQRVNPVNFIEGYLGQANHGFYYFFVAPLFIVAAGRFVQAAGKAFCQLYNQGRISKNTLRAIGILNRRRFKNRWWFLIVLFVTSVLGLEFYSYFSVKNGRSKETGYVQAPFLNKWTNNVSIDGWKLLAKRHETEAIEQHCRAGLQAASIESVEMWQTNGALRFSDPTNAIPQLWSELVKKGAFVLDLQKAYDKSLLLLDCKLARFPRSQKELAWHGAFVVGVQFLEGGFYAFAAWIALKGIYWILILWRLLPGPNQKTKIRLLLTDPRKHFGLSDLNEPYSRLVFLLALGAFAFPLVILSGVPRISPGDLTASAHAFLSVFLIALGVGAPTLVLGLGPILLFNRRLQHLRDKAIFQLDKQMRENQRDPEKLESIEKQKEVISQQTCWPKEDVGFKRLILAAVFFTIIPVFLHFRYVPHEVEKYLSAVRICDETCKKATDLIYHVTRL